MVLNLTNVNTLIVLGDTGHSARPTMRSVGAYGAAPFARTLCPDTQQPCDVRRVSGDGRPSYYECTDCHREYDLTGKPLDPGPEAGDIDRQGRTHTGGRA